MYFIKLKIKINKLISTILSTSLYDTRQAHITWSPQRLRRKGGDHLTGRSNNGVLTPRSAFSNYDEFQAGTMAGFVYL